MGDLKLRAISKELDDEIKRMIKNIKNILGYPDIKIKDACKVLAWKSRQYKVTISNKKIREILNENEIPK